MKRRCLTLQYRNDAVRSAKHQRAWTIIHRRNRSEKCTGANLVPRFERRGHLNEGDSIIAPPVTHADVGNRTRLVRQMNRRVCGVATDEIGTCSARFRNTR